MKRIQWIASSYLWGAISCCAAIACEERATVELRIEKTSVQVAEPFDVAIVAVAPVECELGFPEVPDRIGDFDVVSHRDKFAVPKSEDPANRTWTRELTLETIETGELTIPSFEIGVSGILALERMIRTESRTMTVVSVLEEAGSEDLRDINNVIDLALPKQQSRTWIGWLAGTGLVLALATVLVRLGKRKRLISPQRWARDQFSRLKRSSELNAGNTEFVFGKLESIVRTTCETEFEFSAGSSSQSQLVDSLKERLPEPTCKRVADFFGRSEQVRFAGLDVSGEALQSSVSEAEEIVDLILESARDHLPAQELAR